MRKKSEKLPKLSKQLVTDVSRYVNLRFDHLAGDERKQRIRDTIQALKATNKTTQAEYSRNVENFFEINAGILVESFSNAKRELDNAEVTALLNIDKDRMKELVMKHGGNINAVLGELRADNDQSGSS
jgi:hypothetical protein